MKLNTHTKTANGQANMELLNRQIVIFNFTPENVDETLASLERHFEAVASSAERQIKQLEKLHAVEEEVAS